MEDNEKKYPEGHFVGQWIGIGIAIFSGIGVPLSIVMDNWGLIAIGPAIGVAIGAAIGSSIEAKKEEEGLIRPPTDKEKKQKKFVVIAGVITLIIGVLLLFVLSIM